MKKNYFCASNLEGFMAKQKKSQGDQQLEAVEQALSKTEQYIEENQNTLLIVVAAIVVIIGGFQGYKYLVQAPLEKEAATEMAWAERQFEKNDVNGALNGNGINLGFIDVASDFSSTKAGNLANYYAGLAYMQQGDYVSAIDFLEDFDGDDEILSAVHFGAIGDCFAQINQPEEALEYYTKAANARDNSFTTPLYLMKAGMTAESLDQSAAALKMYKRIESEFPDSREAQNIEKYIARAEAKG